METIAQLFLHPQIIGLKEATGQYGQWLLLSQSLDLKEKAWLAGDDDAVAVTQILGGSGVISASANIAPSLFVSLHQSAVAGDWPKAFRIQKQVNSLIRSLFLETSPAPIKYALSLVGFGDPALRLPLVAISAETSRKVEEAMRSLELLP